MIHMQITFRDDELAFLYGKDVKLKSITPHGDFEFTVLFEYTNEKLTPLINEKPTETKTTTPPQVCIDISNEMEYEQPSELECPPVEDIVEYLRSRENTVYDNALLQTYFFDRTLDTKVETNFYHRLKDATKKALLITEKEDNGKWEEKGYRNLGKTRRVKQYIFVKSKITPTKNIQGNNEAQLKDVMAKLSNEIKNELITIDKENETQH